MTTDTPAARLEAAREAAFRYANDSGDDDHMYTFTEDGKAEMYRRLDALIAAAEAAALERAERALATVVRGHMAPFGYAVGINAVLVSVSNEFYAAIRALREGDK